MTDSAPSLVPELAVTELTASLAFWRDLIGFRIRYSRPEEGFAFLELGRAQVMLDQIGLGRTWSTGTWEHPLGRGVNLQVQVEALDPALDRLTGAGWPLFAGPEHRWYRVDGDERGVVQVLVQDPDGYLLRLQASAGRRPAP